MREALVNGCQLSPGMGPPITEEIIVICKAKARAAFIDRGHDWRIEDELRIVLNWLRGYYHRWLAGMPTPLLEVEPVRPLQERMAEYIKRRRNDVMLLG